MRLLTIGAMLMMVTAPLPAAAVITGLELHGPAQITIAKRDYVGWLGGQFTMDVYVHFFTPIADDFTGQLNLNYQTASYSTYNFGSARGEPTNFASIDYVNGRVKELTLFFDDEQTTSYVTLHTFGFERTYGGRGSYLGRWTPSDDPNVSPLPEPSTWAALLLGFAIVGSAFRFRRKRRMAG